MTSLVCWIGKDHRKVNSVYIVTDSRITIGNHVVSDSAQKVFACATRPEIYGYCGSADRPPEVLRSLVSALDSGSIEMTAASGYDSAEQVRRFLAGQLPITAAGPDYSNTVIVRAVRTGEGFERAEFSVFQFYVTAGGWDWSSVELPDVSDVVVAMGSGADRVRKWREYWSSAQGRRRTSRGVFSALCGALRAEEDHWSGGPPQLVGMYQEGPAIVFGVIFNGARYLLGREVPADAATHWRDELFQIFDGESMKPGPLAAVHLRPRGL
jgi:hypothetical protein